MVYNLASAKSFLEQTKEPLQIRMRELQGERYLIVYDGIVKIVSRSYAGDIGIDFVEYESTVESVISDIYKLRKFINRHFNR